MLLERIYSNMTLKELYHDYITGSDIPLTTTLRDVKKIVQDILKEEVDNGYRNKVTGAKTTPNQKPVKHKISFEVYYRNKGIKSVPRTLQALSNTHKAITVLTEKEIVDNKCSRYVYEITTTLSDEELPKIFYNNGASSVYLKR